MTSPFWRLLWAQFIFLFGGIWALVGTPFLAAAAWAAYAKPKDEKVLVLVFGLLGLVFAGSGWTMVALAVRKASREAALLREGVPIRATVVEVRQSERVRINNRFPYYLVYRFRGYDGVERTVESPYLPRDQESAWKAGDALEVYADPARPEFFMADIHGLAQRR